MLLFTSESFLFLSAVQNNYDFTFVYRSVKFYSHIKVQYKKRQRAVSITQCWERIVLQHRKEQRRVEKTA